MTYILSARETAAGRFGMLVLDVDIYVLS